MRFDCELYDGGLEAEGTSIARHTAALEAQGRGTTDNHSGDQETLGGVLGVLDPYFWSIPACHMPASYTAPKSENILCSTTILNVYL